MGRDLLRSYAAASAPLLAARPVSKHAGVNAGVGGGAGDACGLDDDQQSATASGWLPLRRQCDHPRRSDQTPVSGMRQQP